MTGSFSELSPGVRNGTQMAVLIMTDKLIGYAKGSWIRPTRPNFEGLKVSSKRKSQP